VALVLADNLRPHTPRGSRLVRALLAEAQGSLRLVYTPHYDPEAKRIAWLWRIVRQAVTHHHHREEFAVLLDDLWHDFDALTQRPTAVLAHIGSPGVLNDEPTQPLAYAT
jgi:transposase